MRSKIELHNVDCLPFIQNCKDNEFDLAIVDPPYGLDIANMDMGVGNGVKHTKLKNRKWKPKDWDKQIPSKKYFEELKRVSINQIIWGGNYFDLPPCYGFCIWEKGSPEGMSFSDCEFAWHSFKKVAKLYKYSTYKNKNKIHPTQKPVKLYEWLLMNYAKDGDKILDTHGGSMSIAIAVHNMNVINKMNLSLDLCELDKEYYDEGKKRYENHIKQKTIFNMQT